MKLRTLRYYISEALRSLIKNRLMSIASILTVASCLLIVAVFYTLAANLDYFMQQVENSIEITAFIGKELSIEDANDLYNAVSEIPHVTSVRYVSSTDALDTFRSWLEDDNVLEGLERDNPLNRSFIITMDELRSLDAVLDALGGLESQGIYRVRHSQEFADAALAVSNAVRVVCVVLILLLAFVSIIIIINTIRITVTARKTEINIMKYVGATDWFIRWPFLIEGMLIGLLGGFIPVVVCWAGYDSAVVAILDALPVISFVSFRPGYEVFTYLFPFSLFLGTLIGLIGSGTSVRRHLKV